MNENPSYQGTPKSKETRGEIERRKTFAIISHPDAGKTTLTEKLLLYGGVLREAGSVKAKSGKKHVTSDWMELERKRGISVTTTAIQFEHKGYCLNLLDTPGHKDFSEDTYRTLMAVDAAVMLIDAAKGVEPQTRKLFEVCRQAGLPIFTFVNKMDRESKNPLQLMDEIEDVLGIKCCAVNWPLGSGMTFSGVYELTGNKLHLFDRDNSAQKHRKSQAEIFSQISDVKKLEMFQSPFFKFALDTFIEETELLEGVGDQPDKEMIISGRQSPVFFGSAMNNFGIELFLDFFVEVAPGPVPRRLVSSGSYPPTGEFSGVVFKVQANMNPQHRDCLAFLRICSGEYEKGVEVCNSRTRKSLKLNNAFSILGRDRTPIDAAYAGDIIGVVDSGRQLSIGDTLAVDKNVEYLVWTRFLPEIFAEVRFLDPQKRKQLTKGLEQLSGEGVIQCFDRPGQPNPLPIVGAVGQLQLDVFVYRMETEYKVKIALQTLPYTTSKLIASPHSTVSQSYGGDWIVLKDFDGNLLVGFHSEWSANVFLNSNKEARLADDYAMLYTMKRGEFGTH